MRTFCAIAVAVGLCQPLVGAADTVRQIPLPTRDIAFDRVSAKIYASLPSRSRFPTTGSPCTWRRMGRPQCAGCLW